MTRAAVAALWSHWRRAPLQLFTLVAGLALATALWSGVQAINAEARASYDAAAATLGEGQYDQIVATEGGTIAQADWIALRRAGWLVSPVVEGRMAGARLVGVEPLTLPGTIAPVGTGDGADLVEFLQGARVFAHPDAAGALDGSGIAVTTDPDMAPGTVIADIGLAQRLLQMDGRLSRLVVAPDQPQGRAELADLAPGLSLRPARDGADVGRLTDSFHLNLTAFGALSFVVGLFIVHGAIGLAFEQRRGLVRTLRALGLPLRRLVALMAAELGVLALSAGVIGLALGYGMAAALLPDVAVTLRGLYGADVAGGLTLRPVWALSGLGIALLGTAVAATGAFLRLARTPLLATARARAVTRDARARSRMQAAGAVVLLLAALGFGLWGEGLVAGFALLGCLLIGGALALPPILDAVLALAERRARGPVAAWVLSDTRAQLPGLSLALAALLLAMSANVGVSTMVSSFRLTFLGFLDQVLAAEVYLYTADADQAARIEAFVTPRVTSVLPLMSVDRTLAGLPGEVYAARDDRTYRDNWQFLDAVPGVWDRLAAGEGVIVNEQLARRAGLSLGDPLDVGITLPVIGVYGDYGNPIGQAIVTETLFRSLYPDALPLRFGLRLPPGDVPALMQSLRDDAGLDPGAMVDQEGIKRLSREIFERTFLVTDALNVLTLAVAGFAMLMSLLTLAQMRLPQLAPVWAMGLTRRHLARLELGRAVGLAALTGAVALPLGLALAWVLLAVVNVEAFGWRLPMFLFPGDWLGLFALALVAAALAAWWPARRLARTPPAALLAVFAHER